jgi:hypothetical protein
VLRARPETHERVGALISGSSGAVVERSWKNLGATGGKKLIAG